VISITSSTIARIGIACAINVSQKGFDRVVVEQKMRWKLFFRAARPGGIVIARKLIKLRTVTRFEQGVVIMAPLRSD